jgi:hypothetical protein
MILYNKTKFDKLKFKFNKSDKIEQNFSQAYQDMFALSMLNGKENGTFLEIGAYDAKFISNTYLLEKEFNWRGVSIDIEPSVKSSFANYSRNSNVIISDALTLDYEKIFEDNNFGKQIDFLQIDIEPQSNTLKCLKKLPLDKYRFSVIAFETDFYDTSVSREDSLKNREESRKIISSFGYELVVGNVCNVSTEDPFEDWWVDPNVVSREIIDLFKNSSEYNNTSESFMLNL